MFKKYCIISLFFICSTLKVFCSQNNIKELNDQLIAQLIAENDSSIVSIQNENKVYLNFANIISNECGLFLRTSNGEFYRIPFLFSNDQGCFTLLSQENFTVYPRIKCWNCDKYFTPTFFNKGKCPHCGEQN